SLSKLCRFIDNIDQKSLWLLLAVAPFVGINHNAYDFVEELDRLATTYPKQVCQILSVVLKNYQPSYDYQDRLRDLLGKLVKAGFRVEAIEYLNKNRHLKGMEQFYKELTQV
ncbi:MAG: hypothetical protein KBG98_10285, partial [Desulfobacter sp.]|uniref:hypothetical protein n=1 Tax=Desulfobacter sp. TaxID=2294 RepID=UPI001B720BE8